MLAKRHSKRIVSLIAIAAVLVSFIAAQPKLGVADSKLSLIHI